MIEPLAHISYSVAPRASNRDRSGSADINTQASPAERFFDCYLVVFESEASRYIVDPLLKEVVHSVSPKQLQFFQFPVLEEAEPAEIVKLYGNGSVRRKFAQ